MLLYYIPDVLEIIVPVKEKILWLVFFISTIKVGNMTIESPNSLRNGEDDLRARFTSWISVIVWRARQDYFRAQKRHFREIPIDEIDEIPDDSGFEVLEKDEFIFADERLALAFRSLSLCQQQVLTLRIAKGLSPVEIADLMGCDSARISRQLYKGPSNLRSRMEQEASANEEC